MKTEKNTTIATEKKVTLPALNPEATAFVKATVQWGKTLEKRAAVLAAEWTTLSEGMDEEGKLQLSKDIGIHWKAAGLAASTLSMMRDRLGMPKLRNRNSDGGDHGNAKSLDANALAALEYMAIVSLRWDDVPAAFGRLKTAAYKAQKAGASGPTAEKKREYLATLRQFISTLK